MEDPLGTGENETSPLLQQIRNMWQFANLCQWIYIFGKAAKVDDSVDIEEIEAECLNPQSAKLSNIALALLKLVSSHRGLNHEILDQQLRKQYIANAPDQNPFGDEANPVSFANLSVITKIKILQKLTQWTMMYPERIRERMEEQKDNEQINWRIEPFGWDHEDRIYFVLDDNRIYRLTQPNINAQSNLGKRKHSRGGRRPGKRRRIVSPSETEHAGSIDDGHVAGLESADDVVGGVWECVAVTLEETRVFLNSLNRTRDENEKILRERVEKHLLPILEKQEEAMKRRQQQRERERINLAKMANAKRSSRIALKLEKQKQDEEEREQYRQQLEAEKAQQREILSQQKASEERDFRMFSRQRRLKERELRRMRYAEELAQLSEDSKNAQETPRVSERQLVAEIEKKRQAMRAIQLEEEDWVFDCKCGLYGQIDDGTHSLACERCNIWQHSSCLGISEKEAEKPDFRFVCTSCDRRETENCKTSKTIIKLKVPPAKGSAMPAEHQYDSEISQPGELRTAENHLS